MTDIVQMIDQLPRKRVLGEITALAAQRFAVAIGDDNPLYFDDAYAKAAGYPGVIVPPTYLPAVLGWEAGPAQKDLLADGNDPGAVQPELEGMRLMGGGQELTFHAAARPGDVVTAERRLVELYRKETRSGQVVFAVTKVQYMNQLGELLLECRETLMALE